MSHKDVEFMSDLENPQPRQLKHDPTEKKMFVCVNLSKQFQSNQASFNQAQKDLYNLDKYLEGVGTQVTGLDAEIIRNPNFGNFTS